MSSLLQTERNPSYAFQVLSRCPKTSDETAKQRIADTLMYQHGSLRVWFYTEADSQEVLRRDRREWSAERIVDIFSDGAPPGVPVAMYVHYAAGRSLENHMPSSGGLNSTTGSVSVANSSGIPDEVSAMDRVIDLATRYCHQYGDDAEPLSVDYFDADTLRAFLATRENKHNVILQKFIRGKADSATMVQIVWSPHNVLARQRQNRHSLIDIRVPLYQRANTFDNTTHLSHEVRPTATISTRLDAECKKIVSHIFSVEQRVVTRMVAFFAFDAQRLPVLLFVSELQLTTQPSTHDHVRRALTNLVKRKLCMVTPQIIPSDVVFPDYAKLGSNGGGGTRGGDAAGGNSSNRASAGIGGGGAELSIHASSKSTHIRHALHAAHARTFDQQVRVLEETFDSAYEARSDRGMLSDEMRHRIGGASVFEQHAVPSDAWNERQEDFLKKRQTSLLRVGKRFYVADPLVRNHDAVARDESIVPRPTSAASFTGSVRLHSSASAGVGSLAGNHGRSESSLSLRHRGYFVSRPGMSITSHSEVRYTRGGGGGLYIRSPSRSRDCDGGKRGHTAGGGGTSGTVPDASSLDSPNLDSHSNTSFEGTIAALKLNSGPHTPLRQSGSTSRCSSPYHGAAPSLAATMTLSDATSLMLTHAARHDEVQEHVTWDQWKVKLTAAAKYRRMISETEGKARVLIQGRSVGETEVASPVVSQENLRDACNEWCDVELLNLAACDPEHILRLDIVRERRSVPRRLNLWLLFRPALSMHWAYASTDLHRRAVDSVDEVRSALDTSYLATQALIGGAPWCDVRFHIAIDGTRWTQSLEKTRSAATGIPVVTSADPLNDVACLPWEVAAWVFSALLETSVASWAAADVTSRSVTSSSIFEKVAKMSPVDPCPPLVTAQKSANALLGMLHTVGSSKGSGADGSWQLRVVKRDNSGGGDDYANAPSARSIILVVQVCLVSVTSERLGKIRAALRSISATLLSSWHFVALTLLRTLKSQSERVVATTVKTTTTTAAGRLRALNQQAVPMTEVALPRFFVCPDEADAAAVDAGDDFGAAASGATLVTLPQECWRVVVDTVAAAVESLEKHVRSNSTEWPPRLAFVP